MTNNLSGVLAEFIARTLFRFKGYKIMSKNYKTGKGTHAGEIDFIAKKSKTIIFVEVKKRKSVENASYAISDNQKKRIINGARGFLQKNHKYQNYNIRFDAVLISFPFQIRHIKNAWQEF